MDQEEESWVIKGVCIVKDLKTLQHPQGWLNASIINGCITKFKCHESVQVMDAFFFLYMDKNKRDLARPQGKRFLMFPVNTESQHWSLGVIDTLLQKRILFDSLNQSRFCANNAQAFFQKSKSLIHWPASFRDEIHEACPQQQNGYDCGIYMLYFLKILCENPTIQQFPPFDSQIFRIELCQSLL